MADNVDELDLEEELPDEDGYHEYSLTSYPSDFSLSVLYEQWQNGDIVIPDFQRSFVWNIKQASKLIESFLVGLPIPQIFLYVDDDNKLLVIDGQQRITSIGYFLAGYFGSENAGRRTVFRLTGLSDESPYAGKTFADLDAATQRKLRSAPLRAINIRQLKPQMDHSSVYHIFERLNTGGTPLKSQEIRNAVYRGVFSNLLKQFNQIPQWRTLLGKTEFDKHMRDVELLLRVFSLTYYRDSYDGKMKDFLSKIMASNKELNNQHTQHFIDAFPKIAALLANGLGHNPFSRGGPINSAMLEAVFCACLWYPDRAFAANLSQNFAKLRNDPAFINAISAATNSRERVNRRFERAVELLFA